MYSERYDVLGEVVALQTGGAMARPKHNKK